MTESTVAQRAETLFQEQRHAIFRRTDRMFAMLMIGQWVFGIAVAIWFSPFGWEGKAKSVHVHVYAAVFLGAALSSLPVALAFFRPGWVVTRYVIACAQMLWSALLIHLSGGRIETHFHVFGSLAFLAFYRDWKVLVPATVVVASDHLIRQIFWPESVYGIVSPEWWRFLEHAFWVLFEDVFLIGACIAGVREMREVAEKQAAVEALSRSEREKSTALDAALADLKKSQESLVRGEKLAAIGQLAASVGHELRNPLAAVRNANTYIGKRLRDGHITTKDARVGQFVDVVERELDACSKIIGDLLDFARERPPTLEPCPLPPLVDEAISLVRQGEVKVTNDVPADLPTPNLDRQQFRQILVNLIQNAVEAIPSGQPGEVVVRAEGGGAERLRVTISDNGHGIAKETLAKIFEPLYTTKNKGTGLGLAIVASVVRRHNATISVESEPGRGTRFHVELPPAAAQRAA